MVKKNDKALVIVESPAKVKTLSKILGKKYEIKASYGHIRDLPKKSFGLKIDKNFKPNYKLIPGRANKIIKELKDLLKSFNKLILATDPDREGEAIAWHIAEALKVPSKKVERVSFNEITPPAVLDAFKNPRDISMDLVNAQQARRFLDRIVGYKLSPLLWRKIARGLSAGRVQSVAVKLLVDRENEIKDFNPKEYWKISADLKSAKDDKQVFNALLTKLGDKAIGSPAEKSTELIITTEPSSKKLSEAIESSSLSVSKVTQKTNTQSPPPPFITSTLQQQSSTQLGFSTKKTMLIAQQLYEGVDISGEPTALITYMRTDSVRVSELAIKDCRDFVQKKYGKNFLNKTVRRYKTKKSAQEAHEAVRPTYADKVPADIKEYLTADQYKLYNLIWRRFVSTQMAPSQWKNKQIEIESSFNKPLDLEITKISKDEEQQKGKIKIQKCVFKTDEKSLAFKGYQKLYSPEEVKLPALKEKDKINLEKLLSNQNFTQPPPRYTEASLVKTLEKHGIGRPSTYAPIISTIQDRGYVKKDRRQLAATELGMLVTKKLIPFFKDILNPKFTSQMEEKLDKIEDSKEDWINVLNVFSKPFQVDLEKATQEMTKEKGKESAGGEKCDKCGSAMVERWGRFGKFIACSGYPNCRNIISLKPQAKIEETDETCEKCGKKMVIKINRRGQKFLACPGYPDCKNTKSIKKTPEKESD